MSNQSLPKVELKGLLSDEDFAIFQHVNAYAGVAFSVLGIGSNFLNIKTFVTMGVDDAVTVSFLGLSISDFFISIIMFCIGISMSFHAIELSLGIRYTYDPLMFVMFFTNAGIALYMVTILTTLYLAVARCMCVAKPLHFKHVFTKSRSIAILIVFFVFCVGIYSPVFNSLGISVTFNPVLNRTRYTIWYNQGQEEVKDIIYFITHDVIPFGTQIIVIVCIVVMTWNLIQSSRFRQQTTKSQADGKEAGDANSSSSSVKLSGKELQAVQQVVLISVIFAVFNMPMILVGVFGMTEPEFDAIWGKHRYARMYYAGHFMRRVCEQINSAVNIFIYYRYNTKFRKFCKLC
ncbi:uncharacterized protein LOC101860637 [Aplysia californica]|uniref:Uncharacterized protein LOC101860637 n=1 Tax=Aplysia californica TaxID=6500 RepID=A0ABM0JHM9_APLCA|nr:uncharacterized protein LOC101860637 [Aplysia californica]